ncbi:unnamed protein product, partial [Owenia fusiformis]
RKMKLLKMRGRTNFLTFSLFYTVLVLQQLVTYGEEDTRVVTLTAREVDEFVVSHDIRIIYFFKKDDFRVTNFQEQYRKASLALDPYGVKCGWYDCGSQKHESCNKHAVEKHVYTYKDGMDLIDLELDTLFNVDAIVSNVLQLVLLQDVPIVQTEFELEGMLSSHKGRQDVILSYQRAIGTYDHRIFMEVAFAYQHKYKFVVSTDSASVKKYLTEQNRQKHSIVWVVRCKDIKKTSEPCSVSYFQDSMDLVSLVKFIKALDLPKSYDIPEDGSVGTPTPYHKQNMHVAYVFYDKTTRKEALKLSEGLYNAFSGIIGVVTINTAEQGLDEYGYDNTMSPIAVTFKLREQENLNVWDGVTSIEAVCGFITELLSTTIRQRSSDSAYAMRSGDESDSLYDDRIDAYDEGDDYEVLTQDDELAKAMWDIRDEKVDMTHVPALTDKTFPELLAEKDLLIVLYYLRTDSRGSLFTHAFSEISSTLALENVTPLATVECWDWTDICGKENITFYPTLRIYRKGKQSIDYKGLLDGHSVLAAIRLLMEAAPIQLETTKEVEGFIDGYKTDILKGASQTTVLGLFESSDVKGIATFNDVADRLHGKMLSGIVTGDTANAVATKYNTKPPAVLVLKKQQDKQQYAKYDGPIESKDIMTFIEKSRLPAFTMLTIQTFPALHKAGKPFIILFCDQCQSSRAFKSVQEIAEDEVLPHLTFSWMELYQEDGVAEIVLKTYLEGDMTVPALAYVDLSNGQTFVYLDDFDKSASILKWLNMVNKGEMEPSKTLPKTKWAPQHRGFNFLEKMDFDALSHQYKDSRSTPENQHGIGFDEDGNQVTDTTEEEIPDSSSRNTDEDDVRGNLHELKNSRLYHHKSEKNIKHKDTFHHDPSEL